MADNDQIAVTIVAQTSGYTQALSSAASQTEAFGQRANAATSSISTGFDSIASAATRVAGILGVSFSIDALANLASSALQAAENVEHLSQSIGASAQTIQTLSFAAGLTGSNLDVMTGALTRLERAGELAVSGGAQQVEAFRAIGISASQLGVLLKNPDQLIQVVTQHLSQLQDGANKTAILIELMGRGAAQNAPLINKLGTEFGSLTEQAKELGVVLDDEDTKALAAAQGAINLLGQEVKGLGNQFAVALLPAIQAADQKLSDFLTSSSVKTGIEVFGAGLANVVDHLNDIASISGRVAAGGLPSYLSDAAGSATSLVAQSNLLYEVFQKIVAILPSFNFDWFAQIKNGIQNLGVNAFAAAEKSWNDIKTDASAAGIVVSGVLSGMSGGMLNVDAALSANESDWKKNSAAIDAGAASAKASIAATNSASAAQDEWGTHLADSGREADNAGKKQGDYNAKIGNTAAVVASAQKALEGLQNQATALAAKAGGPYAQAWAQYQGEIAKLDDEYAKAIANTKNYDAAQQALQAGMANAKAILDAQVQAMQNLNDADAILSHSLADQTSDWQTQLQLLTENKEAAEADALANQLITKALGDLKNFMGPLTQAQQDEIDQLNAMAQGFVAQKTAIQNANEATKEWVSIWETAGSDLADTFAKILVEGGSLFGGLVNLAKQTVEQIIAYFAKLAVIDPILNSIFGGSAGFSALPTLESAGVSALTGGNGVSSLLSAGGTMGQGFMSTVTNAWDAFTGADGGQSVLGSLTGTGDFDFGGSSIGMVGSIAGGALAGFQIGQQFGGTAGGILGAGALGAAAYFVPVIGWIAGAASLINSLTGGGLFGTKGSFNFGQTALTVGPGGATATAGYDVKGKSPLFGGSTHSWQSVTPDQAAVDAANSFYTALLNGTDAFAQSFGVKAGAIVGGQFLQNYDKKGNPTTSSDTVLGVTYNDTQQQFGERLQAENMLAVLGQFDKGLSDAVNQFRGNADQLLAVTNALAQGETMMQSGTQFLALGSNQSLTALLALAEGSQQFGESIDQTLQRLEQAQSQYDQFVAQFKPAATYTSSFQAALAGIGTQLQANIAQANALAKAAGAEGASVQDLANIHAYAAAQFAAAVTQLKAATASLAQQAGYAPSTDLNSINSQISALEQQRSAYAQSINGASNALQEAAQRAQQAMNLLLGDLSPYNDQQKLQLALAGQRAGTVTPDQVLTIARQLYASGADYNAIFNQVMAVGDRTGQHQGSSGGGSGSWSSTDAQHLADLQQQAATLQAQQAHTNAVQIAQNIADEVAATGESITQALSDAGITSGGLAQFIKDLGVTNENGLDAFIANLEKQTDSAGDTTATLSAQLAAQNQTNVLLAQLVTQGGGTPDYSGPQSGSTGSGPTPPGHSGRGTPPPPQRGSRQSAPLAPSRVR